jgi:queuine tRNA-ribosyltransferase
MMSGSGEDVMKFEVLKAVLAEGASARLGRLTFPRRKVLETPDFFSLTSRGVVPHITPDNLSKYVHNGGVYVGLEDCRFSV